MPIYEYACNQCGHEFETLLRSGAKAQCPGCQSSDLDKQLSVFATTTASSSAAAAMPAACGSCGSCENRGSEQACGMH